MSCVDQLPSTQHSMVAVPCRRHRAAESPETKSQSLSGLVLHLKYKTSWLIHLIAMFRFDLSFLFCVPPVVL